MIKLLVIYRLPPFVCGGCSRIVLNTVHIVIIITKHSELLATLTRLCMGRADNLLRYAVGTFIRLGLTEPCECLEFK